MSNERAQRTTMLATYLLYLFPPSVRESLLAESDLVSRYGIHTDATITLNPIGVSFSQEKLFGAVRAGLGGAVDEVVRATDGTSWRVGVTTSNGRQVVVLEQGERKIPLPGLSILSPVTQERISEFDDDVAAAGIGDAAIDEWRRRVERAPVADGDVDRIARELRNSPCRVAAAISQELANGQTNIALLAPEEPRYYERLVGAWNGEDNLSEFIGRSVTKHIKKLIAWRPVEGLKLALLMASHPSVSEVIAAQPLPLGVLLEAYEQLTKTGDRFSQVALFEIGVALLPTYPELEGLLAPLVRQIVTDDPSVEGRLTLLSRLIVFVEGEIARRRTIEAPPYWRRLAAITQAALVAREVIAAGVPVDSLCSELAQFGRGQFFYLQTLVDLRKEPRWLPDFVNPNQLKSEFLGRIANAAQAHKASIRSDELQNLLFATEEGGVQSLLNFPYPFLPGPLEGGVEATNEMPQEISAAVREQLQARTLQPNSFAALVNSALIFKIGPDHAELAAAALRRARYQFRGRSSELDFSLVNGLSTVAAVTRSPELARDVRILSRGLRRRGSIGAEDEMRVGLIAAAAFLDKAEWSTFVGDWLTELAFEDLKKEQASKLLSHIRVLCHLEPELWRTCARAEAALASIAD